MTRPTALLLSLLTGCYLHHTREQPADAAADATVEASVDAQVDAIADAATDAATDADAEVDAGWCGTEVLTTAPILAPVDIVWSIDSSRSMQDERERLQATINDFAARVRRRVPDLRVVMISAEDIVPPPLGTDASSYLFVPFNVDSKDALLALLDAHPRYASFLRPDALLHLVVVSDDDSVLDGDTFVRLAGNLFRKPLTVHAIASPDVNGGPCRTEIPSTLCLQTGIQAVCGAAQIGVEYYRAATLTGGLSIDVCLGDWTRVIGPLGDAVVGTDRVPCTGTINPPANGQAVTAIHATLRTSNSTGLMIPPVDRVDACGTSHGLHRGTVDGRDVWTLCPTSCAAASDRQAVLTLLLECDSEALP